MAYSQHSRQHGLDKPWMWWMLRGTTKMPPSELNYSLCQQPGALAANGLHLSLLLELPSPNRSCLAQVLPFPSGINNDWSMWRYKSSTPFPQCEPWQLQGSLQISGGLCCNCITFHLLPWPVLLPNSLRGVASENISKINLLHVTKHLRAYFQENWT